MSINPDRPLIAYIGGEFYHCTKAKVVHRPGMISVGCTDIAVIAARRLLAEHDKVDKFPADDLKPFTVFRHYKGQEPISIGYYGRLEDARIAACRDLDELASWYLTIERGGEVIDTFRRRMYGKRGAR